MMLADVIVQNAVKNHIKLKPLLKQRGFSYHAKNIKQVVPVFRAKLLTAYRFQAIF